MTLFLDTSALVKRYRAERGTDAVLTAMRRDRQWVVSALSAAEARIAFCAAWGGPVPADVPDRLASDLARCLVVPVDPECLARAAELGCALGLRTLDAIHLAAADRQPRPRAFLAFDRRQSDAAVTLGHTVIPAPPHRGAG